MVLSVLKRDRQIQTVLFQQRMAARGFQISSDHFSTHFLCCDLRHPAKLFFGFGGGAKQRLDFGGAEMDTQSPTGKLMLTMFGALAQFERELMLVRQREGIERAKAAGKYRGRVPTARRRLPEMRELAKEGLTPPEIANRLNLSRASVYRLLKEDRA